VRTADKDYRGTLTKSLYQGTRAVACRRVTQNGLPFSLQDLWEANYVEGTRVNLDAMKLCVASSSPNLGHKQHKYSHYIREFKTVTSVNVHGHKTVVHGYSYRMLLGGDVTVNSDSPSLMKTDLRGFTPKGEAVYATSRAAARALYLFCLFDMPHVRGQVTNPNGLPPWLAKHCDKVKQGKSVFFYLTDAIGLMGEHRYGTFNKHRLFGVITPGTKGEYDFYVPCEDTPYSQTQDRDDWERFNVRPPPFVALADCCSPDGTRGYPRTLIGKHFCVEALPACKMAKVFHYGPAVQDPNNGVDGKCYYHAVVAGTELAMFFFDCATVLRGCGYSKK
jgi:hypothetical protein